MHAQPKINLIITGGTLDKVYHETEGTLTFAETHLPQMLKQAHATLNLSSRVLMLKDSLDMTDADRQVLAEACQASSAQHLVITHGTDTMVETAHYLAQAHLKKRIVLTGAMRPFSLGHSDALFNLGTALAFVQMLPNPGVFIAMNGHCFPFDQVQKNRQLGRFEWISKGNGEFQRQSE